MRLNENEFVSFSEYVEDLKDNDYLRFDTGFIKEMNNNHIVDIFRDIIEREKIKVTFGETERRKYMYKPKSLSDELYGTPDLYFIILKMNNLTHPGELDLKNPIYVMEPNNVTELIGSIQETKALLNQ